MPSDGTKNLIPVTMRSKEEAKALSKKGGIRSGQVRAARKKFKEDLLERLENGNSQDKMINSILQRAENGDLEAFKIIRDTIGEKPIDQVEQKQTIIDMGSLSDKDLDKILNS